MSTTEPERLSIAEAAEMLGLHPNSVRYRVKRGLYPSEKVLTAYGPAYMIPRAVIEADLVTQTTGASNGSGGSNGAHAPQDSVALTTLSPQDLEPALQRALMPLVDELARARADAAAAHERAGRLQAERDAAVLERNMERTRRYELQEQRRGLLRRVWAALAGSERP